MYSNNSPSRAKDARTAANSTKDVLIGGEKLYAGASESEQQPLSVVGILPFAECAMESSEILSHN